jgi:hypothetical protein
MPPEPIYPPPAPPDLPDAPPNPPQPPLSPFIDPPFVAVGVYVLNAGSDDAYAGYVDLDFLLYTKVPTPPAPRVTGGSGLESS